jgi:hypothetical protein
MNCSDARENLPAFLYGDLDARFADDLATHLNSCPQCQRERAALERVRRLLDNVPAQAPKVDVVGLYGRIAEKQRRRARRWRRAAGVVFAAAASVTVFAFLPHFEMRFEAQQWVLRWGTPPAGDPSVAVAPAAMPSGNDRPSAWSSPQIEEQLEVLSELVQGQRAELTRLQELLHDLQNQLATLTNGWRAGERTLAAAIPISNVQPKKGTSP